MTYVKFWGVRGSIPSPLTPDQIEKKIKHAFECAERGDPYDSLSFIERKTFGGNTTCVEVDTGNHTIILDMGTGVRELGKVQLQKAFAKKALRGTILQSHVHWDHIQGLPFWGPMYLPRNKFDCEFDFYGGKQWDSKLDEVYRGQMDAPYFPVNLQELEHTAMKMNFNAVYDGWKLTQRRGEGYFFDITARKLNHPQETFGYRIDVFDGVKTTGIAFTTDHEPYAAGVPKPLLELVDGADVWITDCQYSHDEYVGKSGPQKMGWGHSFPEYIANVAKEAKPKSIMTTHHDPDSDDRRIVELAAYVEALSNIETTPAFEGLTLELSIK